MQRAVAEHFFEFDAGHHIGTQSVTQMPQLVGVIRTPAGGHHDGANVLCTKLTTMIHADGEFSRTTFGFCHQGIGEDRDGRFGLDLCDQFDQAIWLGVAIRRQIRHGF